LISSREVAVAVGICYTARKTEAIIVVTTAALGIFSFPNFFDFDFVFILEVKRLRFFL
jgi:hypothetical protein